MTDPHQSALQRQLENDEPKCANCKHWNRIKFQAATSGVCGGAAYEGWESSADGGAVIKGLVTLDLSVCSKWEPKG